MAEYNGYCETGEGAYEYGNESNAGIVGWVNRNFPDQEVKQVYYSKCCNGLEGVSFKTRVLFPCS